MLFAFSLTDERMNAISNAPNNEEIEICFIDEETGNPVSECSLHLAGLILSLASSVAQRRKNKKVVNAWPPFLDLLKFLKTAMKYVFDKKNKRVGDYRAVLALIKTDAICCELPNSTRIAGIVLLFQSFLRSLHGLRYYATQRPAFARLMPSHLQCRQIAEFEAVMRPTQKICFDFQQDRVEVGAETPLTLINLQLDYQDNRIYDVVDVGGVKEWEPNCPFDKLATVKVSTNNDVAEENNMS